MNFFKFLRPFKSPLNNNFAFNTIRGAKRKGEKKQEGVLSEHILNVYKNAEDVSILPDEYYPPWVFDLAREPMVTEEMVMNSYLGICIPHPSDMHTINKKARRQLKFKIRNKLRDASALYPKDWEKKPLQGHQNELDAEWGNLPDVIHETYLEEQRNDGSEDQKQGGGGAAAGGAPAEKKAEPPKDK